MIKIRLSRHGSKNNIFYRIVAIEKSKKREGAPLSVLGTWDPLKNKKIINKNELNSWRAKGAFITKAVEKILR